MTRIDTRKELKKFVSLFPDRLLVLVQNQSPDVRRYGAAKGDWLVDFEDIEPPRCMMLMSHSNRWGFFSFAERRDFFFLRVKPLPKGYETPEGAYIAWRLSQCPSVSV